MLRGNKYASVETENRYGFGNKHIIMVQTSIAPEALVKPLVIPRKDKPRCITATTMPEPYNFYTQ